MLNCTSLVLMMPQRKDSRIESMQIRIRRLRLHSKLELAQALETVFARQP